MTVVPDGRRRLSEGVVVEARLLGRLLGLRLLKIDADLVIAPAQVRSAPADVSTEARSPANGAADAPPASRRLPAGTPRDLGRGLAEAARYLEEGRTTLAAARHNGSAASVGDGRATR